MSLEEGQGSETFTIIDEKDPTGPYNQDIPQAKEELQKFIQENRKEMLDYGEPLSEKMSEFTGKAKEWITDRLKKYGIAESEIHMADVVTVDTLSYSKDDPRTLGANYSPLGIAAIAEGDLKRMIEDDDLRDYIEGRIIFEELWHSTGTSRFKMDQRKEDGVHYHKESVGFNTIKISARGFPSTYNALEEGLAQFVAEDFEKDFLASEFPEGHQKYKKYLSDHGITNSAQTVWTQHGDEVTFRSIHPNEKALVGELVYGCFKGETDLLERYRITHESVALARKLTETYGPGAYKKVMTAEGFLIKIKDELVAARMERSIPEEDS